MAAWNPLSTFYTRTIKLFPGKKVSWPYTSKIVTPDSAKISCTMIDFRGCVVDSNLLSGSDIDRLMEALMGLDSL